ncbi:hypothetical protein D9615_009218 [Tricholomella constricta]|uniref:Uncharacterized protein n=1 Tax=Tricholomella constricta TaxID=117010 RepID=A0A8H5H2J8_9AGAR|nr:hypothetical protein D9615_009218 [Tricholomella constricta]
MALTLDSNYSAPPRSPITRAAHKRSSSTTSTSSSLSSTSSNGGSSLRERRGVNFRLSFIGIPTSVDIISPKGHLEPNFLNVPRRRRALPAPVAVFEYDLVMGKAGAKSARARDYGMGEDGWTVAL